MGCTRSCRETVSLSQFPIRTCYRAAVAVKTAISLDDYVYQSAKTCSAALGQSMTEWLNNAARAAARRQNAEAYLRWASEQGRLGLNELDEATADISLKRAEW